MNERCSSLTFAAFAVIWLRDYAVVRLKSTGLREYESLLRAHLIPAFGDRLLDEITSHDLQVYLAGKVRAGLSPRTVTNHLMLLRSMFKSAGSWGLTAGNPAAEVAALRQPRPERPFLTAPQMAGLIQATTPSWRLLIALPCLTGCRKGEALALDWSAVDTRARTLRFNRSIRRGVVSDTKTPSSRATVPMPSSLTALFEERRSRCASRSGLVFCRSDGSPLSDAVPNRVLAASLTRAALPHVRFHDLRRSWVMAHLEARTPVQTIVTLGRWKSPDIFISEYAEYLPSGGQDAAQAVDRLFSDDGAEE